MNAKSIHPRIPNAATMLITVTIVCVPDIILLYMCTTKKNEKKKKTKPFSSKKNVEKRETVKLSILGLTNDNGEGAPPISCLLLIYAQQRRIKKRRQNPFLRKKNVRKLRS